MADINFDRVYIVAQGVSGSRNVKYFAIADPPNRENLGPIARSYVNVSAGNLRQIELLCRGSTGKKAEKVLEEIDRILK